MFFNYHWCRYTNNDNKQIDNIQICRNVRGIDFIDSIKIADNKIFKIIWETSIIFLSIIINNDKINTIFIF